MYALKKKLLVLIGVAVMAVGGVTQIDFIPRANECGVLSGYSFVLRIGEAKAEGPVQLKGRRVFYTFTGDITPEDSYCKCSIFRKDCGPACY